MTLAERIPSMTDADLASLLVNAVRLSAGDGAHKREAATLVPALQAEIGARKARKARGADAKASAAGNSNSKRRKNGA